MSFVLLLRVTAATVGIRERTFSYIMPPKRNLKNQRQENTDALREVMAEFQQDLRHTLQTSMESALRAVLHANQQAQPIVPPVENLNFDEGEEEEDGHNPFGDEQQEQIVAHGFDNRRWESGFKLDLPDFDGSLRPEEFLDWLNSVEELLTFKQVPDEMHVSLVAIRFKSRASAWWQNLKAQRQ